MPGFKKVIFIKNKIFHDHRLTMRRNFWKFVDNFWKFIDTFWKFIDNFWKYIDTFQEFNDNFWKFITFKKLSIKNYP